MTEKHIKEMTEAEAVVDIGLAWFTPETWRELRAHPAAKIEDTYSEYVRRYERFTAAAQGRFRVVKVPIDIPLMVAWCHAHGYEIDSGGRAVFAAAMAAAQDAGEDIREFGVLR